MKIELIKSHIPSAGNTILSADHSQGKLNGLIIANVPSLTGLVTIKLRDHKQTHVLVNRLSIEFLGFISDLSYGVGLAPRLKTSVETAISEIAENAISNVTTSAVLDSNILIDYRHNTADLQGVYIPLGNIDLEDKELDIIYDTGETSTNTVKLYTVLMAEGPDKYLTYDETSDQNINVAGVREVFLDLPSMIGETGAVAQRDFQIDIKNGRTLLFDTEGAIMSTKLFGGVESLSSKRFARLFSETLPVPADLRVKVTGGSTKLVFLREFYPSTTKTSTVNNLDELLRRVEALEKSDPATAKSLIDSGEIVSSNQLRQIKVEASLK